MHVLKSIKYLGPGLLESAYEAVLVFELKKRGLKVATQISQPVLYEQITLDIGYRIDILVSDIVIVELKSVENVLPVHKKQLLTYLRLSGKKLGILANFGAELMKDGIFRVIN